MCSAFCIIICNTTQKCVNEREITFSSLQVKYDVSAKFENYQEQIVLVHLVQKCLIKKINFHVYDECPNYKQMFGQLTSARNRGGYVVFTDYKACMCSYGISLNDRIKSWLFIVNNGMGIQITSISPKKCWYY